MNRFVLPHGRRCAIVVFALGAVLMAVQAAAALPTPVTRALKRFGVPPEHLSLFVQPVDAFAPVLLYRADVPRPPASTIKLLTTLVALETLGPAYQWKTEFYAGAPVKSGRLGGDLYIKGYGDPYLVVESFWKDLRALRAMGVQQIDGDLVADDSYFQVPSRRPGAFDGRPYRPYNVAPSALLVNFSAVRFMFLPDPEGRGVHVAADPVSPKLAVDNRLRLGSGKCPEFLPVATGVRVRGQKSTVTFSGRYPAACGARALYRAVLPPDTYLDALFRELWRELGGSFNGRVRRAAVPSNAIHLYTGHSRSLAQVIRGINKYSNNVMARQLLLTLGAQELGAPGDTAKGIEVVHRWLAARHLDFPELVLDNGAGLSRKTRISARHLGMVLLAGYHSPYMPEFISSLPLGGMDGTLKHRFDDQPITGHLHVKTGSLAGALGMAGFVQDRRGRLWAVVCLLHDPRADSGAGKAVEDAVFQWLFRH